MKLSVVIPVYNRASLLPMTLRSLLAQERIADEILVVDDGSTDGSGQIAESFGYPVRVIRQENRGPAAARNRGLAEAHGEYIHFFDSDDLALPNLHRVQLDALEDSKADVAYSPWVKASIDPLMGLQLTNHVLQARGLPRGSLVRALLTNWSIVPICCLLRRSLVLRIGGFPEFLHFAEDQLFFLSLLLEAAQCIHTPSTLVLYRDEEYLKLSGGDPSLKPQQYMDWASFLLTAHFDCIVKGLDPSLWFGFRRRVFYALNDLQDRTHATAELAENLEILLQKSSTPFFAYTFTRYIQTKGESVTARLLNRRAHRSFMPAPISLNKLNSANLHVSDLEHGII